MMDINATLYILLQICSRILILYCLPICMGICFVLSGYYIVVTETSVLLHLSLLALDIIRFELNSFFMDLESNPTEYQM